MWAIVNIIEIQYVNVVILIKEISSEHKRML